MDTGNRKHQRSTKENSVSELNNLIKKHTYKSTYTERSWLRVPHEDLPRLMELIELLKNNTISIQGEVK